MPADPRNSDPWGNHYFSLELGGIEVAHFLECSGMKCTAEVFEIEEGGFNGQVHRMAGRSKWENIVLKSATSCSTLLLEWRDEYLQDKFSSRPTTNGSIVLRDNAGTELRRFNFVRAFPVSWEGPQLNSGGSALAIETLEIGHEGIYIDGTPPEPPEIPEEPEEPEDPPDIVIDEDDPQIQTPPVHFKPDSPEFMPDGQEVCDKVAQALNNHPEIITVWVEGHTNPINGTWASNMTLSTQRAQAVANDLKRQRSNKTFIPMGFAWKYPISQTVPTANRRTEFWTTSPESRGRSQSPVPMPFKCE
jgi:phage tail-like protein